MTKQNAHSWAKRIMTFFFGLSVAMFIFTTVMCGIWFAGDPTLTTGLKFLIVCSQLTLGVWVFVYREAHLAMKGDGEMPFRLRRISMALVVIFGMQIVEGSIRYMTMEKDERRSFSKSFNFGGDDKPVTSDGRTVSISLDDVADRILPKTEGMATALLAVLLYLLSENLRTNRRMQDELDLVV